MSMPSKIKAFIAEYWPMGLLVLISAFVYRRWLSFDIFTNQDWMFNFRENLIDNLSPSIWQSNFDTGQVDLIFWKMPLNFCYGFLAWLGLNFNYMDKILVFWPFVFLTPVAGFLIVKQATKSIPAAFVGSFVFSFNTYFLAINTQGHLYLSMACVFSTLAVWSFLKSLELSSVYRSVFAALLLFISGSYDFRFAYISLFVSFFYTAWRLLLFHQNKSKKEWIKTIAIATMFVVVFVLSNLYWVIPFINLGSLVSNDVLVRSLTFDNYLNILKTFSFFHPFWLSDGPDWFSFQTPPVYFWLIPFVAFWGLWLNRKNKDVVFFGLIALLGILLSKQLDSPFVGFYSWLRNNLPGFGAFREATKFYFLIIIGYSVLIGSFVSWIWKKGGTGITNKMVKYSAVILISGLFFYNTKAILNDSIGTMFIPRQVPADYLDFKNFVTNQNDYFKILWVPVDSRWSIQTNNHPKISADEMNRISWKDYFGSEVRDNNSFSGNGVEYFLTQPYFDQLAKVSSIKYVVLLESNRRDIYSRGFEDIGYVPVNKFEGENIRVYENNNFRPHIYLTERRETIYRDIPFQAVDFQFATPAEYKIHLENVEDPVFINFSDRFHPDWKLRAGNFSWWQAIFQKDYFLPDQNHFENDAKLNSFYLDPKEICARYGCQKSQDNGYDLDLTLFFKPQGWFYFGLIISGATLIACLAFLIYAIIKKR